MDFEWIAEDNTTVPMDAHTMFAFGCMVANFKDKLIKRAKELKQLAPIPQDYTNPAHWVITGDSA